MDDLSEEFRIYLDDRDYELNVSDDEGTLSRDDLFHLLQSSKRRALLWYISGFDPPYGGKWRRQLHVLKNKKPPDQINSKERKTVYINLHQAHLPKLDDFRVIDYVECSGEFERGDNFSVMESFVSDQFYCDKDKVEVDETSSGGKVFTGIL